MRKVLLCAAAVLFASGLVSVGAPSAQATFCGSVGGRHIDVTGCADPFSYLNDALPPPPLPPPRVYYAPQYPDVNVCADVGRRFTVSGCI